MLAHIRANLLLLALSILICCLIYPAVLLGVGQALFADKANGSLITNRQGEVIGSRLIAQPFTADEYFWPRPSAVSYNAAASGASNWGANNYLLRERVARALGPIVKYASGPKKGQPVAADIQAWFQKDQFRGNGGIVAQWALTHSSLAQNWVKADKLNAAYVAVWQKEHPKEVARWIEDNPDNPEPKPDDLAVPFFVSYSRTYPGTFPSAVQHNAPAGKNDKRIETVKEGADIQGIFFDTWRQEHSEADVEPVPADMVMASGSGLDPDITLANALYQLDRVSAKWAEKTKQDRMDVRQRIEGLLRNNTRAPLGGLVGADLVNVLEVNLALLSYFEPTSPVK